MTIINVCHYPSLTFFGLDNDSHGVLFSSLTLFPMTVISMCHFPSFSYFAHDNSLHGEPFSSIYLLRPWQWFAWWAIFIYELHCSWQWSAWRAIFHHWIASLLTMIWMACHFPSFSYFVLNLHGAPFSIIDLLTLFLTMIFMEYHFPSLTYFALDDDLHGAPLSIIDFLCAWQWFAWCAIIHHWLTLPLMMIFMEHHYP